MAVTAIVGANWGDEGKGKMTDVLAAESAYVVRFQGGSNAGHTIINHYGKFGLHMLPSGVFYPGVTNVIGPGVALDCGMLAAELRMLADRGVPASALLISERAQLVLPVHRLLDQLEEERLGAQSFGSTRRGIAPFYADKFAKLGIEAADLLDAPRLERRIAQSLAAKNILLQHLYGQAPLDPGELAQELLAEAQPVLPYVCDTTLLLQEACRQGAAIVMEGQLGALRDPDYGIYPYTTSSSTLAGYAAIGGGVPPYAIQNVVAVTKAYSSCVGAGPFVVELHGAVGEELRGRGGDAGEYGVLTGRPRRVGWFDAVATRYGCLVQGATEVALTNLDVLGYLGHIPVCTAYELTDGTITADFPATARLEGARPVLQQLPGWRCSLSECRTFGELPVKAREYVSFVEARIGVAITSVSVGPRREQLIRR